MSEGPQDKRPDLLQLLEELDQLQEEQRTLDLRDLRAVEDCQRKIDALRQKIKLLDMRGNAQASSCESAGRRAPAKNASDARGR